MTPRGRWLLGLAVVLTLAACSTKYIKFPAEAYLVSYWKDRLSIQDETHAARQRCQAIRAVLLAPGTGVPVVLPTPAKIEEKRVKCDALENRMTELEARDRATVQASLKGDTIDKESVDNIRAIVGPLLGLARDIMAP